MQARENKIVLQTGGVIGVPAPGKAALYINDDHTMTIKDSSDNTYTFTSFDATEELYVNATGDTMTGTLTISGADLTMTSLTGISGNFLTVDNQGTVIDSEISYKDIYNLDASLQALIGDRTSTTVSVSGDTIIDTVFYDEYDDGYIGARWLITVMSNDGNVRMEDILAITDLLEIKEVKTETESIGDTSSVVFTPYLDGNSMRLKATVTASASTSWKIKTSRTTL